MNIIKDVMFEMFCHNTGCKREGHLQDRYGSVDTDTGWGQADHEECDKCGQKMEYYPPFKEDDNGQ